MFVLSAIRILLNAYYQYLSQIDNVSKQRPPDVGDTMKTVAATEAKNRLGAILVAAQQEPIVIRRKDRDIAVVLSTADYERLRSANAQTFVDLRNEVAAEAAKAGLTDELLAELLNDDDA